MKIITCKHCGKEFEHDNSKRGGAPVYCSEECRKTAESVLNRQYCAKSREKKKAENPLEERRCLNCGKLFIPTRRNNWYCSLQCRHRTERTKCREKALMAEGKELRKEGVTLTGVCPVCGKEFTYVAARGNKTRKYCSESCRHKVGNAKRDRKKAVYLKDMSPEEIARMKADLEEAKQRKAERKAQVEAERKVLAAKRKAERERRKDAVKREKGRLALMRRLERQERMAQAKKEREAAKKLEREQRDAELRKRKCSVCGEPVNSVYPGRIYCSAECSREESFRRAQINKGLPDVCYYCGEPMPEGVHGRFCSPECRAAYKEEKERKAAEREEEEIFESSKINLRKCHDCGRPTPDYRCPRCWAKKRGREYGYTEIYGEDYDFAW